MSIDSYYKDLKTYYMNWWERMEFKQGLEICNLPSPHSDVYILSCLNRAAKVVAIAFFDSVGKTGSHIYKPEGLSYNFLWHINREYNNDAEFNYHHFQKGLIHSTLMVDIDKYNFNYTKVEVNLIIFINNNELEFTDDEMYFMLEFQFNILFQKRNDANVKAFIEHFAKQSLSFMRNYQPQNYVDFDSMQLSSDEIFRILTNQFDYLFHIKNDADVKAFIYYFVNHSLDFMDNYPQNNNVVDIEFEQFISKVKSKIEEYEYQFSQLENVVITNELQYMQSEQSLTQIRVELLDIICDIDDAFSEKENKKEHLKQLIKLISALISKIQNKIQSLNYSNDSTN